MQEPDEYHYGVFISYRHRPNDEKWALWLQEAIETYETPPEIAQKGFGSSLGRVFVDDTEMAAAADLTQEIKTALWQSKSLIVVCSPDTPHSAWVREEISLFRNAWQRRQRTLALLIFADPKTSYPPELLEIKSVGVGPDTVTETIEPAGANVTEVQDKTETELKALALDKFAATILGCDLGELRDRQAERISKQTTKRFYTDMVRRHGIPQGVGEVTEENQKYRNKTHCFHYRSDRVRGIDSVNGSDFPREEGGICRWDISYRRDGTIEAIDHRNRHGDTKLRKVFNLDATIVDFFHDDHAASNFLYNTANLFNRHQHQTLETIYV